MATPPRTRAPVPAAGDDGDQNDAGPSHPHADAEQRGPTTDADPGRVDDIVQKLESRLHWATADLENLRKRYDREIVRERAMERSRVVGEWLPVVDNLDLALRHVDHAPGAASDAVLAGLRAIRDQAIGALDRLGFAPFDDIGQPFDPSRHEAVSTIESEASDGTIVATVRPGYANADGVVRPAAVIVSRRRGPMPVDRARAGGSDAGGSMSREPT